MEKSIPNVVLVDDENEILNSLKRVIGKFECHLHTFSDPKMALCFLQNNEVSIICTDQRMPSISGIELLDATRLLWPKCHRIMLSAHQDFDDVADGFNSGVIQQFIAKPWSNKELEITFKQALKIDEQDEKERFGNMIGQSEVMFDLFQLIKSAAGANVPIFIHGETGTGKELVAKACHDYSYRKDSPFVAVNCAILSDTLIESQLFGHKKGAFTGAIKDHIGYFELAERGTLFLDEITTLPLALQAKLLRVIQEREFSPLGEHRTKTFNAQIVTASSTRLLRAVEQGMFREDLYYRLAVIKLTTPRLADRKSDIVLISQYFIDKYSQELDKKFEGLSDEAAEYVTQYSWPGNVRQLENLIHAVIILNKGKLITKAMLMKNMDDILKLSEPPTNETAIGDFVIKPLAVVEKEYILSAIARCDGNIVMASKLLEVNPSTIYRKMSKW